MTVLSARELNPTLFIVARIVHGEAESKLRRAGADRVVSPYQIGGHRIALALLRPTVHDFLDEHLQFRRGAGRGHRAGTGAGGFPAGGGDGRQRAICERQHNVSILAIQKPNREVIITPSPAQQLEVGSTLIIIGPPETVTELEKEFQRGE